MNAVLFETPSQSISTTSLIAVTKHYRATARLVAAPRKTTPDEWADDNRILPPGTAEPGKWRSSRTPWTVAICRAAVNPRVRRVINVTGSQTSKTETVLNIAGHKLDTDAAPMLFVGPTKSNVDTVIEPRVADMLKQCPSLASKTVTGRKAKKLAKSIAGVLFRLAWAGSPTELASQPAHTVILVEIDRMKPIPGEGDPVSLAEARTATYPDGRLIICSSPTEGTVDVEKHAETGIEHWRLAAADAVGSPIWRLYQEGTRYEWAFACMACGHHFVPRFHLLTWPEKCTPKRAISDARLTCQRCGESLDDSAKFAMNAGATFLAPGQDVVGYDPTKPGRPWHPQLGFGDHNGEVVGLAEETDTWSFWTSGLCSPWVTFGQRAAAWLRAARSGDQERVRVVLNTAFGELYAVRGEAPQWEDVRATCAADYQHGTVPAEAAWLFCTVDVQKDRLVYVVRGWGPAFESWLVERGEIWADTETDKPDVWSKLDALVARQWDGMALRACAVDSGYRTDQVYEWCLKYGAAAYAIKGRDSPRKIFASTDVPVGARTLKLWTLDDKHFKAWVHARLGWPKDRPGAWHLPTGEWTGVEDYCKQLVAEQQLRMPSGRVTWIGGHKAHDFLDCEAMQAFLAHAQGVRDLRQKGEQQVPVPAPQPRRPVVRSAGVSVY
jgi:phage terminase large subunit GpA-like protein